MEAGFFNPALMASLWDNTMATNSEKLDQLVSEVSNIKTDIALIKNSQIDFKKTLTGNGKVGLVDKVGCHDEEITQIKNSLTTLLSEREKQKNTKDKWFWLLVEKFAVPIALAAVTAKVLAPLLK